MKLFKKIASMAVAALMSLSVIPVSDNSHLTVTAADFTYPVQNSALQSMIPTAILIYTAARGLLPEFVDAEQVLTMKSGI